MHVRAETNLGCDGAGVSAESMRAHAVAVLEAAEVPLLTEQEMLASPGIPELMVTFECGGGVAGALKGVMETKLGKFAEVFREASGEEGGSTCPRSPLRAGRCQNTIMWCGFVRSWNLPTQERSRRNADVARQMLRAGLWQTPGSRASW